MSLLFKVCCVSTLKVRRSFNIIRIADSIIYYDSEFLTDK